jgi:hypothetical protein
MSSSIRKAFSKFILFLIMLVVFVTFWRQIATDDTLNKFIGEIMSNLPFSKQITDTICKVMKWNLDPSSLVSGNVWGNDVSQKNFLTELTKLAVLACLQPLIGRLVAATFLRMPSNLRDWQDREEYMDSAPYRVKEFIINLITVPLVALLASWLITQLYDWLNQTLNGSVPQMVIIFLILVGALLLLSMNGMFTPLQYAQIGTGRLLATGILWRLLVTAAMPLLNTFLTTALCYWIYLAFLNNSDSAKFWSIVSLIGYLLLFNIAMTAMKQAIVGVSYPRR